MAQQKEPLNLIGVQTSQVRCDLTVWPFEGPSNKKS